MIRAFLAVNASVAVVRRIVDDARALATAAAAAGLEVAWVPAANVHLTLKFLGPTKEEAVEAIVGRLRRDLGARGPFELEARGMGAFPDPARPKILWAGVSAHPALAALQADVEHACGELGFPREERPFHPHLTVGRVKGGAGSLEAALGARAATVYGASRVAEVVLYESRTRAAGAEYVALARVPLGGATTRTGEQQANR